MQAFSLRCAFVSLMEMFFLVFLKPNLIKHLKIKSDNECKEFFANVEISLHLN